MKRFIQKLIKIIIIRIRETLKIINLNAKNVHKKYTIGINLDYFAK